MHTYGIYCNTHVAYIDRLVQGRRNWSALAMELRLSWNNPSVYAEMNVCYIDIFISISS